MPVTVCFCGHSRLSGEYDTVKEKCFAVVRQQIEAGADSFLIGDYGNFDHLAAAVYLDLKREYPDIQVCLVLPYYQPHIDEYEKRRRDRFDSVITPDLANTPHRLRIIKVNEWMVMEADTVIAYVNSPYGGAAKTLDFAKRKKKNIVNLAKMEGK